MGTGHSNHNNAVFESGLARFREKWTRKAFLALSSIAEEMVDYIEDISGRTLPVQTGNLADSTGVGVYMDGTLVRYIPRRLATAPRTKIYGVSADNRTYWGYEELERAFQLGQSHFTSGFWICVFSTMPYAAYIDNITDYFQDIKDNKLEQLVKERLHEII